MRTRADIPNQDTIDDRAGRPSPRGRARRVVLAVTLALATMPWWGGCWGSSSVDCPGCFLDGVCLGGASVQACGTGGEVCAVCHEGQTCTDGDCQGEIEPSACADCLGCCQNDTCLEGQADAACGTGGWACQVCGPGTACQHGQCVFLCGPGQCGGCCLDGICQEGDLPSACGTGGGLCQNCGSETCSSGQCISLSCSQTCPGCCAGDTCQNGVTPAACGQDGEACVTCPPHHTCTDQTCTIDPASRWDLVLVNAEAATTKENGDAWDPFGGLPDIRIDVILDPGNYEGTSSTIDDTLTPLWDEVVVANFPASLLIGGGVQFIAEDVDYDSNDPMLDVTVIPASWDFSGNIIDLPSPSGSYHGIALIRVRLQPHH